MNSSISGNTVLIIVADDHSLMREALRRHVNTLSPHVQIQEADSYTSVVEACHGTEAPALVLLDLNMPGMNGAESVRRLRDLLPSSKIVVFSAITDPVTIRTTMRSGIDGYIPKTMQGDALVSALAFILGGGTYIPPDSLEEASGQTPPGRVAGGDGAGTDFEDPFTQLSDREATVLRLLMTGKANKEIALDLGLRESTVKIHLRNIFRKIEANNRTDAVRIAMERGWE